MTNKYLLTSLLAGTALVAAAAAPQFTVGKMHGEGAKFEKNAPAKKAVNKSQAPSFSKKAAGPQKMAGFAGSNVSEVEQYGTLELLLEEDFSRLDSYGTEEEPDVLQVLELKEPLYPWWNFDPRFTTLPNWGIYNAYPAGGAIYFNAENDGCRVNTCLVDCTKGDNNIAVVEFRARCADAGQTFDYLAVEGADTNNMGPSWDEFGTIQFTGVPDQWTTFRVVFPYAGPTSLFNIYAYGPGHLLVDDVKVYQLHPYVKIPTVLPHTDYTANSFVANWEAVEGADSYLLNVYSYDESIYENDYLLSNVEVAGTETSYKVEKTVDGQIYWYNVTAVKGDKKSVVSNDMRVYDLSAPTMKEPEVLGEHSYKASWTLPAGGDVACYYAYDKRVATEDGPFVITNENFDNVVDVDGYPTGLTKDDPSPYNYDQYYSRELTQQGWLTNWGCPYDGYMAICAWWYEVGDETASLESPALDLSKDGGKFTLEVDLAADVSEIYDEDGNAYEYPTQACVALFNYNETTRQYDQVELFDTREATHPNVTNDWNRYTFNFTKGTENSIVSIFAVYSYDNLYVDNLKITQNYKKGEYFMDPFLYRHWHGSKDGEDPYFIEVEVPSWASGNEVYHKVSAYGRIANEMMQVYDDRQSVYTPLSYVCKTEWYSGVANVMGENSRVNRVADQIMIDNPEGLAVSVVSLGGQTLLNTKAETATVSLPARGLYIVRVGDKTYKVIY